MEINIIETRVSRQTFSSPCQLCHFSAEGERLEWLSSGSSGFPENPCGASPCKFGFNNFALLLSFLAFSD